MANVKLGTYTKAEARARRLKDRMASALREYWEDVEQLEVVDIVGDIETALDEALVETFEGELEDRPFRYFHTRGPLE